MRKCIAVLLMSLGLLANTAGSAMAGNVTCQGSKCTDTVQHDTCKRTPANQPPPKGPGQC